MSARRPEEPAESNAADAADDPDTPEPSVDQPPAKRARGTALDSARTNVAALLFKVEKLEAEIDRDEALQDTSSKIKQRFLKGQSKMPDLKAKLAAARKKMLELEEVCAGALCLPSSAVAHRPRLILRRIQGSAFEHPHEAIESLLGGEAEALLDGLLIATHQAREGGAAPLAACTLDIPTIFSTITCCCHALDDGHNNVALLVEEPLSELLHHLRPGRSALLLDDLVDAQS